MSAHQRSHATQKAVDEAGPRWRGAFCKLTIKFKDGQTFFSHDPSRLRVSSRSITFPDSSAKPSSELYLSEFVPGHMADDLGLEMNIFVVAVAVFSKRPDRQCILAQRGNVR